MDHVTASVKKKRDFMQKTTQKREKGMEHVIEEWRLHSYDSGSVDVKIGIYTEKISRLSCQMKGSTGVDFAQMRKLLVKYVVERHKLLMYLQNTDLMRYRKIMTKIKKLS